MKPQHLVSQTEVKTLNFGIIIGDKLSGSSKHQTTEYAPRFTISVFDPLV